MIDERFCYLCPAFKNETCQEKLGECREWKWFENKARGYKLRKLREEKGISQLKLARRLYVDRTYISHLERGCNQITPEIERQYLLAMEGKK